MFACQSKRCPILHVLRNKPIPEGFKCYAAIDYETKIPLDFNMDDKMLNSQNCADKPGGFVGYQVCLLLLEQDEEGVFIRSRYPMEFCRVFTDTYYTSPELAEYLDVQWNIKLTGTLSRAKMCEEIRFRGKKPKPSRQQPRGYTKVAVNGPQTMAQYAVMDNGVVCILDTARHPDERVNVRRWVSRRQEEYTFPAAQADFNDYMGGVDNVDQMKAKFAQELTHKATKWTMNKAHEGLFTFANTIAYTVYGTCHPPGDPLYMERVDFQIEAASYLTTHTFVDRGKNLPRSSRSSSKASPVMPPPPPHKIVQAPPSSETYGNTNRRMRRTCHMCRNKNLKTAHLCASCKKFVHIGDCYEKHCKAAVGALAPVMPAADKVVTKYGL